MLKRLWTDVKGAARWLGDYIWDTFIDAAGLLTDFAVGVWNFFKSAGQRIWWGVKATPLWWKLFAGALAVVWVVAALS